MVTSLSTPTRSGPRTRRSGPARPRGVARRIALLEATLELLAEVGADVLTHRRVAEHAGLPLASTTYWFDSKEHLLTEALRYAAERDEARLRVAADGLIARCEADGTAPSAADVVTVVLDPPPTGAEPGTAPGRPAADTPSPGPGAAALPTPDPHAPERGALLATYALMLEAARRPALQALSRQWTDAYRDTVGDLLRRAGSRRAADDARILMAATDGLLIDRLATGTEADFEPRAELERLARALIAMGDA